MSAISNVDACQSPISSISASAWIPLSRDKTTSAKLEYRKRWPELCWHEADSGLDSGRNLRIYTNPPLASMDECRSSVPHGTIDGASQNRWHKQGHHHWCDRSGIFWDWGEAEGLLDGVLDGSFVQHTQQLAYNPDRKCGMPMYSWLALTTWLIDDLGIHTSSSSRWGISKRSACARSLLIRSDDWKQSANLITSQRVRHPGHYLWAKPVPRAAI